MKFNWKANWEILLVLVIIVIGIVITTIAAIRNKDKNLLVSPEETDFGQMLAGAGAFPETNGLGDGLSKQLGADSALGTFDDDPSTRRPPLSAMIKTSRNYHREASQHHHRNHLGSGNSRGLTATTSKFDDSVEFLGRQQLANAANGEHGHHQQRQQAAPVTSLPLQDIFDVSVSTEPSTNQTGVQFSDSMHSVGRPLAAGSSIRRHHANKTQADLMDNNSQLGAAPAYGSGRATSEPVDLIDDIHTTRSSLAANDQQRQQQQQANYNGQTLDQVPMHPQLSLQAPYGVNPNTLSQLSQLLTHNRDQQQSGSAAMMDADDIINLYSRGNETLLRELNLANTFGGNQSSNSSQLINSEMLANLMGPASNGAEATSSGANPDPYNQQQQLHSTATPAGFPTHHSRGAFSASLPISMLLGDILKLTKPKQPDTSATGSNEQVNPTNKPQNGILQQLKAIPGPLIALLQGISTSHNSQQNQDHPLPPNHDASESNQHYHRIPMSANNIQSILTRSLHTTGVLPAFPAPKGVQQPWIPPTVGGNPDYHTAQNSNADFVASNVAGFVRVSQQGDVPQTTNEHNTFQYLQQQSAQQQQNHLAAQNQQQQGQQQHDLGYQRPNNNEQQVFAQQDGNNQLHQQQQKMPAVYNSIIEQQMAANKPVVFPALPANQQGSNNNWPQQNGLYPVGQHLNELNQDNSNRFKMAASQLASTSGGPSRNNPNNLMMQQQPQHQMPNAAAFMSALMGSTNQASAGFGQKQMFGQQMQQHSNSLPVQLGYSQSQPAVSISQHPQQHSGAESAPKISTGNKQVPSTAETSVDASQSVHKNLRRRKRSTGRRMRSIDRRSSDAAISAKYTAMDEEDDVDSRPISVVRPDGQPTNSGRVNGYLRSSNDEKTSGSDRQAAQSQRNSNHFNLKPAEQKLLPLHYKPPYSGDDDDEMSEMGPRGPSASQRKHGDNNILEPLGSFRSRQIKSGQQASTPFGSFSKLGRQNQNSNKDKKRLILDSAGSGLMSKLLGTASTNDETEEDMDDDDDLSEKRKEDSDDADFGGNNGASNNGDGDERQSRSSSSDGGNSSPDTTSDMKSNLGSGGSTGSPLQAYSRRNQQRSDIEFYGHPGEETRTLKYGILGSGNYEVVNGGIYPDADESTAAVNSVANYVRKPGALISGLPKLLADQGGAQSSFMPGTRMNDGFMRGASGNPDADDLVGIMGPMANKEISAPLLELIDAGGGHLQFDPSLMAQLGSSGSSARSTHALKENDSDSGLDDDLGFEDSSDIRDSFGKSITGSKKDRARGKQIGTKNKNNKVATNEVTGDDDDEQVPARSNKQRSKSGAGVRNEHQHSMDRQPSSISGSRSHGTNQFNSYQILPSKKVTIFSDQDLDSAPSELDWSRQPSTNNDYGRSN